MVFLFSYICKTIFSRMEGKLILQKLIQNTVDHLYQLKEISLEIQENKTQFEGDYTLVLFPLIKLLKKNPELLGNEIGEELTKNEFIQSFNVVKGFLNLSLKDSFFLQSFSKMDQELENIPSKDQTIMVEYSSPNTNKPLHLGHIRNNLLGYSVSKILKENGYKVIKTQIINDRGIHICKSMWAWEQYGNGETPETTGLKGDKLVGNYYVEFDKIYKAEVKELMEIGKDEDTAKKQAPSILAAQQMLQDWEQNNPKVKELWSMMNAWVYEGFAQTYKRLGVDFDQVQYESNTYLLGKDIIKSGVEKGIFYQKEDGSVWIDLSDEGLDQKLLLRADGTSVYMTQDLGTAVERFKNNPIQRLIYTVGNEQDYHFQVLFKILKKLGYPWADQLYHLSYGMVELPEGKMKSREGTVVDADELMEEMVQTAKQKAQELGKLENLSQEEKEKSYEIVGLGALKYFMLKVDPKKKMLFNPSESIDFNGNTGPFIQYTYARIQSLLHKAGNIEPFAHHLRLTQEEKSLILLLSNYRENVEKAAEALSPAIIANFVYEVVKTYNSFYQTHPVLNNEDHQVKNFRLQLSQTTGNIIRKSLSLLGIDVVDRM